MSLYTMRLSQDIIDGIRRAAKAEGRSQTGLVNDIFARWLADWNRYQQIVDGEEDIWRKDNERLRNENARLKFALVEKLGVLDELLRAAVQVNESYKAENSYDGRLEWAIKTARKLLENAAKEEAQGGVSPEPSA